LKKSTPKTKKDTGNETLSTDENLERLSKDTGISSEQLLKISSETLPLIPRSFVFEMRDGKDAKSTILKMFDCATIGKGILEVIEQELGVKGFIADDTNCEVSVKSASDFRVWVHMNASIDRVPKSINLDEIDVDIDKSGVQVIYGRTLEKLTPPRKEHIKKEVGENQESYCDELTGACENYELVFDDIDDEYNNLQLTIQCDDLGDAPKAEDVSKMFDRICD
jgi:hypothetical protein